LLKELQRQTSIDPFDRIALETTPQGFTTRALDLLTPIGKGQRCLIVAPPKAGKTTLLKDVALAVAQNQPEIEVYVLLVDERPEEVTDFRRAVTAQVFAASSDQSASEHVQIADDALHRASRACSRAATCCCSSTPSPGWRAPTRAFGEQRPHPHRRLDALTMQTRDRSSARRARSRAVAA